MSAPVLDLAVSAIHCMASNGKPLPDEVTVLFHVARHPCDDRPYISDVGFERDNQGGATVTDFDSALIARLRNRIAQLELDAEQCNGALLAVEAERDALRRVAQKLAERLADALRFRFDGVAHEALAEWRKLAKEAQP